MANDVAVMNGAGVSAVRYSPDQVALIKSQVAIGCTDQELALFLYQCQRTGLDALSRQMYAIKRGNKMTIQTSIDGYRLIAERSGKYEGQTPVYWCGPDGIWVDVWLAQGNPIAAKVGVNRAGFRDPVWAVAKWAEYCQDQSPMWRKMGALMLGKCAEALALRKAFPQELSGIYTAEEMAQAGNVDVQAEETPRSASMMAPSEIEARKRWKQWRGKLNQRLLAVTTREDLERATQDFEKALNRGGEVWAQYTFHNETETFASLVAEHQARIDRIEFDKSPAAIQLFIRTIEGGASLGGLKACIKAYEDQERFQTTDVEQALTEKAKEYGFESWADLADGPEDRWADTESRSGDK